MEPWDESEGRAPDLVYEGIYPVADLNLPAMPQPNEEEEPDEQEVDQIVFNDDDDHPIVMMGGFLCDFPLDEI